MMKLFLLTCIVAGATAANICCIPDAWEANSMFLQGSYKDGVDGIVEGLQKISYDKVNQLISLAQNIVLNDVPIQQRVVMDYKQSIGYSIKATDGSCNRFRIDNPWVDPCIQDNVTVNAEHLRFGLGADSVDTMYVEFFNAGNKVMLLMTTDTCTPVMQVSETAALDKGPASAGTVTTTLITNFRASIADRAVFYIPVTCNSAPILPAFGGF